MKNAKVTVEIEFLCEDYSEKNLIQTCDALTHVITGTNTVIDFMCPDYSSKGWDIFWNKIRNNEDVIKVSTNYESSIKEL